MLIKAKPDGTEQVVLDGVDDFWYQIDKIEGGWIYYQKGNDKYKIDINGNNKVSDEVWVVSRGAGENLRCLGYTGEYRVVSNGVDFAKGRVAPEKVAKVTDSYDLPEGIPVFLFVGRIVKYKGLPLILDALAKLSQDGVDFRMVFVGSGPDEKEMKEKAASLLKPEQYIFTGAVYDREQLRAWNTRADLFLFPSTYDTNGIVVREAAACGLASVLIGGSCAAEGITDDRNGFLIEETPDAMYRLLKRVGSDLAHLYDVGEHAMFHFDHMFADCIFTEYMQRPFHLRSLKHAFSKWQKALNGRAWNTLYLENHDHPRVISRYGNERYHRASGSMLAVCYLFQQGTPFVYQGQEIGMTNIKLASIDQYVDVSSHNNYHTFHLKDSVEKRMERIHASSRDSARTPMQWDDSKNAGFTTGKPWFYINPNYRKINVAAEEEQPFSILKLYRRCLRYRKNSDVALWGDYKEYDRLSNQLYVYKRTYQQKSLLIVCSFSTHSLKWHNIKEFRGRKGKLVICNYPNPVHGMLKPYEARVYEYKE